MTPRLNATEDRRSEKASMGVACFDCHANAGTNGANHLVGDIRPQEFRHWIETPVLRGVNIQRLFGSRRALKTVEDFTEFEQRAAYLPCSQKVISTSQQPLLYAAYLFGFRFCQCARPAA
jgi:cytochrome c peroxidase